MTQSHVATKYLVERMQAVGDIIVGALQRMDSDQLDCETQELMFKPHAADGKCGGHDAGGRPGNGKELRRATCRPRL